MILVDSNSDKISGVLSCYNRIEIRGVIPTVSYDKGMLSMLNTSKIPLSEYETFSHSLKKQLIHHVETLAFQNALTIADIAHSPAQREKKVTTMINDRGDHPGLVGIFTTKETGLAYRNWFDKRSGKHKLKLIKQKIPHYYFYFIDPQLGLCSLRMPVVFPYELRVSFNGLERLASVLNVKNVSFKLVENTFVEIESFKKAQSFSDSMSVQCIHKKLHAFASVYCPVISQINLRHQWSIKTVGYLTDIVFKRANDLQPIFNQLTNRAIISVKSGNIVSFLGRHPHPNLTGKSGNRFFFCSGGTKIEHSLRSASIKMSQKSRCVFRIETILNNVSFMNCSVNDDPLKSVACEKRNPIKKKLSSLAFLHEQLFDSNRSYLNFLSGFQQSAIKPSRHETIEQSDSTGEIPKKVYTISCANRNNDRAQDLKNRIKDICSEHGIRYK